MGLAAVPGRQAAFREGLEQAVLYAKALGCPRYPSLPYLDHGPGWEKAVSRHHCGPGPLQTAFCISSVSATQLSCSSHTGIPCWEWGSG